MGNSIYLIVLALGAAGIFLLDRGSAVPSPVRLLDHSRAASDDDELEYRPPRLGPSEAINPALG